MTPDVPAVLEQVERTVGGSQHLGPGAVVEASELAALEAPHVAGFLEDVDRGSVRDHLAGTGPVVEELESGYVHYEDSYDRYESSSMPVDPSRYGEGAVPPAASTSAVVPPPSMMISSGTGGAGSSCTPTK